MADTFVIDTHAHLSAEPLLSEIDAIVERALAANVGPIVNICTDEPSLKNGLELAKRYPQILNAASTTPHDAVEGDDPFFPFVSAAAKEGKLVAIGETGLEYYHPNLDIPSQKRFLIRYFQLAKETALPIIFHCRDAFSDLFILADTHYKDRPAVLHCFSGTLEDVKGCLERGWMISFSGIVTFKKSEALRSVLKFVPMDRIVIETDAPYLAPQKHRGALNEPAFVTEVAECIARVKGISLEEVVTKTVENSRNLFALFRHPV